MCPTPHWTSGRAIKRFTHSSSQELAVMGCSCRKRAPLQLRTVDLDREFQMHLGLPLPLGHHRGAHAG
eukprot:2582382-Alexandrium_andersonii.AAC.1